MVAHRQADSTTSATSFSAKSNDLASWVPVLELGISSHPTMTSTTNIKMEEGALVEYVVDASMEQSTAKDVVEEDVDIDLQYDAGEQQKIIHRLDRRLIVTTGAMYCVSLMDRTNMPNAAIAGMNTELKMDVGYRYVSLHANFHSLQNLTAQSSRPWPWYSSSPTQFFNPQRLCSYVKLAHVHFSQRCALPGGLSW